MQATHCFYSYKKFGPTQDLHMSAEHKLQFYPNLSSQVLQDPGSVEESKIKSPLQDSQVMNSEVPSSLSVHYEEPAADVVY